METIVLSLGGSLIVPEYVDSNFLRDFCALIHERIARQRFIIFCGGGKTARHYQEGLRGVRTTTDEDLDWIGLHASRLNAQLVRLAFGADAMPMILDDPDVVVNFSQPVMIGAGWLPGHSTDFDAVQCAVRNDVKRVLNLSNIEYVYREDPRKNPTAEPIRDTTWSEIRHMLGDNWTPGANVPFDPIAAQFAQKHNLTVCVMKGLDLSNVGNALDNKEFRGTTVHP